MWVVILLLGGISMKKQPKTPLSKPWWFWIIMIVIIGVAIAVTKLQTTTKKSTSSADSTSLKQKTVNFNKLSLGMSSKEVIEKLGTPDKKTATMLKYGHDTLYFTDHKLTSGTPKKITKLAAEKKKTQSEDAATKTPEYKQKMLKINALSFGEKDVSTIQKFTGDLYLAKYIDGLGMSYEWTIDNLGTLIRIDNAQTNITTVYVADPNRTNGLGEQLYQGQTITYNSQNNSNI